MIRSRRTRPQPSEPVRRSNRLASRRDAEPVEGSSSRRDVEPVEGSSSTIGGNDISSMVEWLNLIVPYLRLSLDASEEEVRACLVDGTVLCRILNKLCPGSVELGGSSDLGFTNVKRFLAAVEKLGFPTFELIDLEQGSLVPVMRCLSALKASVVVGIQNKKYYQSEKIALETLASETGEVNEAFRGQLKNLDCMLANSKSKKKELESKSSEAVGENRKLYNEVQDLKGQIRVYCRIRPFLPGEVQKQTTIEYVGENGDLVIANPSEPNKDSRKLFKFNRVFGPASTQEEVFLDTQPLIRSVLDGYNVCIFAYGQTGSGKTYTMSGPNVSSKEWGVNYRALNDLFEISQSRKSSIEYEVGIQMVEIYNEQVLDLLSSEGPRKSLGIWNTTQPNGLAVPEASMHLVNSTADVLELMNIGLSNRTVGATALNERSSRSHSVLTVHVRGVDLKTGTAMRSSLHLVDLAGSERVDRSEATGGRLREAQHINKSLSALGDVIFALAQKNAHVPYRNSKLTQVLQSSLGGQAKTLMFVQLNPDAQSFSETLSTLKFAERVSGVELGAAKSNKEGKYVRELNQLVEQVSGLSMGSPEAGKAQGQKTPSVRFAPSTTRKRASRD